MNANERESEIVNQALPFHSRILKIDEQGKVETGGLQIVQALGDVFVYIGCPHT